GVNFHCLPGGTGKVSGSSKDIVLPAVNVHVRLSALRVPVSLAGGRQLTAAAAVVFQQLLLASQAQSRSPPLEPHAASNAAAPIEAIHLVIGIARMTAFEGKHVNARR